ncbi:CBS domain-containing protein [Ramlibacter henchirensis]|nr:CBS domain-containing protein [Ramlibacter henchirensis]
MLARDIMSSPAITVGLASSVAEVAATLRDHRIGGVPVLDCRKKLVGMVTEADLVHRYEIGTDRERELRPWWRRFQGRDTVARRYVKSHGRAVRHVMTSPVRCAEQDASLGDVASLLDAHRIGRVPILAGDEVIGIVTRADLVKALARQPAPGSLQELDDDTIRRRLVQELSAQKWWNGSWQNVYVCGGWVIFKGVVESDAYRLASRVAAENMPGVRGVQDDRVLGVDAYAMV